MLFDNVLFIEVFLVSIFFVLFDVVFLGLVILLVEVKDELYIKLGLFFIWFCFWINWINIWNGGYIVLCLFVYFIVVFVYFFCRLYGNFIIMGFIFIEVL